jgi:LmbE family N-acetylglucosaminyl deacetylase
MTTPTIFLSPHFDDIALSCGGMAARLARMGVRCVAVTVCAAPASEGSPLSDYAQYLHSQWEQSSGTTVQAINDVRREEERQALRILGLEHTWLDVPDAPYRRGSGGEYLYTSDETLIGEGARVAGDERRTLVPRIAAEIERVTREADGTRGRIRVYAPLGVGNHVDHQLVYWAARTLPPRYNVLYYEDYPYAAKEGALPARLETIRRTGLQPQPRITPIGDLVGVKIAAIARYKSQLDVLFGSAEAMPSEVRAYAALVQEQMGGGQPLERYWQIPSVYSLAR